MARDFNGTTDRINCASGIDLSTLSGYTACMWIYRDAGSADREYFYSFESSGSDISVLWFDGSERIGHSLARATTGQSHTIAAGSIPDTTWTHVAFTWDGGTSQDGMTIYVDGSAVTKVAGVDGSGAVTATDAHAIGGRTADDNRNFDGKYAECAIWGVDLGASQILELAKGKPPENVARGSLISYLPLVRGLEDLATGTSATADGTTVYTHPRIYRQSSNILQFPPVVAAGGSILPQMLQHNHFSGGSL